MMGQERRNFTRWQVNREARAKLDGAVAFADAMLQDINLKGMRICLKIGLPKDKFFKLFLSLSEDCIVELEGWVVWHKTIDGHYVYGVYFTEIKDNCKEKIYQFVRKYSPEEINKNWWAGIEKGGVDMADEHLEDKRVFQRFSLRLSLKYLDQLANKEGTGQTMDISAKGIGMLVDEELAPKTPVEIWLDMPDKKEPFYTRGEVVWSNRTDDPAAYRVGVNLDRADLMGISRILR